MKEYYKSTISIQIEAMCLSHVFVKLFKIFSTYVTKTDKL